MKSKTMLIGIVSITMMSTIAVFSACNKADNKVIRLNDTLQKPDMSIYKQAEMLLKEQIIKQAAQYLLEKPVTVTASSSKNSFGSLHDFYSEGDYWWPDPKNPNGPYIQKDGLTNPDNFTAHRKAMIRFSEIIGTLASAYKITRDEKYATQALIHLKAWFINSETLMNPNLSYAQAIKGVTPGRGIGIIDTIHLMEVAQGIIIMEQSKSFDPATVVQLKSWFSKYTEWLTTSKNGLQEKAATNNHGTCWTMQVASFAKLCNNASLLELCRVDYKNVLLNRQMAEDGSFPMELARTKPYGYSIFNLDAMVTLCQILSTEKENLFLYKTADGRSIETGIKWLYPFLQDKGAWKDKQDVMYWNDWPVAQPSLLFGAYAFNVKEWMETWKRLDHAPTEEEVIRNLPIRNPLIWM